MQLRTTCNYLALGSIQHSSHHCFQITLLRGILRLETHISRCKGKEEMAMCEKVTPQVCQVRSCSTVCMPSTVSWAFQRCCATFNGGALMILGRMHQLKDMLWKGCSTKPYCRSPGLTAPGQQVTTVWEVGAWRHLHMGVHNTGVKSKSFDLSTWDVSSLCFLLAGFTSCLLTVQR